MFCWKKESAHKETMVLRVSGEFLFEQMVGFINRADN